MASITRYEPFGPMRGRIDFVVDGGPARVVVEVDRVFYTTREGGYIEPVPPDIYAENKNIISEALEELRSLPA